MAGTAIAKAAIRKSLTSSILSVFRVPSLMRRVSDATICAAAVVMGRNLTRDNNDTIEWVPGMEDLSYLTDQYVENLTFCDFLDDIIEIGAPECTSLFDEVMSEDQYILCHQALKCRTKPELDVVHGTCLAACHNDPREGTTCADNLLIKIGLEHDRVCPSLPPEMKYNFLSYWELLVTVLVSMGLKSIDTMLRGKLDEGFKPSIFDFLNANVQALILLAVSWHALSIINGNDGVQRPSLCGYVGVVVAPLFGPFLFSSGSLWQWFGSIYIGEQLLSTKHIKSEVCSTPMSKARWIFSIPPLCVMVVVSATQAAAWITMSVVSFWGVFAYIHIFLILGIQILVLGCIAFFLVVMAVDFVPQKAETPSLHGSDALISLTLMYWQTLSAPLIFLASGSFLLYVHGDWNKFHDAFFSEWTAPSLSISNPLLLLLHAETLAEQLKDLVTFQYMWPSMAFDLAVAWNVLMVLCNVFSGVVIRVWKQYRKKTLGQDAS